MSNRNVPLNKVTILPIMADISSCFNHFKQDFVFDVICISSKCIFI